MATEKELQAAMAASVEKLLPKDLADQFAQGGVPALREAIKREKPRMAKYTGGVPPQDEGALPNPYNAHPPSAQNIKIDELLKLVVDGFRVKGWIHAMGALDHYLKATGADYPIHPDELMEDIPGFAAKVIKFVAEQAGSKPFDSGWQPFNTDGRFDSGWHDANTDIRDADGKYLGQLNYDWYYTMHDWRYRIAGSESPDRSGNINYTVEVYKPYIFHPYSPDISIPHTGLVVKQEDMADLAIAMNTASTSTYAKEFAIVGQADFTYTVAEAKPGGKAGSSK